MGCCQASRPADVNSPAYVEGVSANKDVPPGETAAADSGWFSSMVHKVEHVAEEIKEGIGNAIDMVTDPFEIFENKLEICIMKTLNWISPVAADQVKGGMIKTMPALEHADHVTEKAHKTVYQTIMEQKDNLLDMCQDILENLKDGGKPIKVLKDTFKRVGCLLLRALKAAVTAGIMAITALVAGCAVCCWCVINVKDIVASLFTKLVRMIKKHLKKILKVHAPDWLVNKLPWNWTDELDIGDAVPIVQKKKQEGIKTAKQEKGQPDRDPAAIKESKRLPKRSKQLLKAAGVGAAGVVGVGLAAGAVGVAVASSGDGENQALLTDVPTDVPPEEEEEEDEQEEGWGDDDDDEEDDDGDDFDHDDGAADEDDEGAAPEEEAPAEEPPVEEAAAPEEEAAAEEPPAEEPGPEEEAAAEEPPAEEPPAEEPAPEEPAPE